MRHILLVKSASPSSGPPSPGHTFTRAWQVVIQRCAGAAGASASVWTSSFWKLVFRKRRGWLTSPSPLCQQGARLHSSMQARCADVPGKDKPSLSRLEALALPFHPGLPAPIPPHRCPSAPSPGGARGTARLKQTAKNTLNFNLSAQKSGCSWVGAAADGGGRLCPPGWQKGLPKVCGYGETALEFIYVASHSCCVIVTWDCEWATVYVMTSLCLLGAFSLIHAVYLQIWMRLWEGKMFALVFLP